MEKIRALQPSDIEVRVGGVYNGGCTMLLYKNARIDMQILDEVFGAENWQRDHKEIKGVVYCGIGVYNERTGHWVWKWDAGSESFTEKEKGEASDSFKRAGTNWGIGRELYTSPFIWLEVATKPKTNGARGYELNNPKELRGIYVSDIQYDEKDGKRVIKSVTLSQSGNKLKTFTNK